MRFNPTKLGDIEFSGEAPALLGLTKREYFAAIAMQGLAAGHYSSSFTSERLTDCAVSIADALIRSLEETPTP